MDGSPRARTCQPGASRVRAGSSNVVYLIQPGNVPGSSSSRFHSVNLDDLEVQIFNCMLSPSSIQPLLSLKFFFTGEQGSKSLQVGSTNCVPHGRHRFTGVVSSREWQV